MSKICDELHAAILQAAMRGDLTDSDNELWYKSKIEEVCELCTGNSIPESIKKSKYAKVTKGRNYIGTKDLGFDHSFNYKNGVKIPFDERNFRIANSGDILLCIEGGSAGRKIGILEEDVNYGNKLCKFSPDDRINNRFLYYYIQSPLFQEQFSNNMTGIIGGVSTKKIKAITIKFPDVVEQKRIIEKVDELMVHITDLEQSTNALESLKKNFPEDIKASLLQAAMQGKLTERLPEDGNAEDLLEKIKAEKEKLITEGKIKKQKALAPITDDAIPFGIPESWKWVRLRDITLDDISYGIIKLGSEDKNGIKVLRCSDVKKGYINTDTVRTVSRSLSDQYSRTLLHGGEIVINVRGTLGGCSIVPGELSGYNIAREVAVIKQTDLVHNRYILAVLLSDYFNEYMFHGLRGIAYKGLNMNTLSLLPIPLPPLAEQKRIVERLDTLMQNLNEVQRLILDE